jgi:hypothetical protein
MTLDAFLRDFVEGAVNLHAAQHAAALAVVLVAAVAFGVWFVERGGRI